MRCYLNKINGENLEECGNNDVYIIAVPVDQAKDSENTKELI